MNSTLVHSILSRWRITLFLCVIVLAGCVPAPNGKPAPGTGELAPPPLQVMGSLKYTVDSARSEVRILVYRGGPLAKAGHNHVLRVRELRGSVYLAEPLRLSGFELAFPVAALEVDPPAARAEEGAEFATALSHQAIEATYRNLIGPAVLDAARYPEITLRSVAVTGTGAVAQVMARIMLHGESRDLPAPVTLENNADGLIISGQFAVRTSEFGMTPFSVLGGGLQVKDEVQIRFRLIARREASG